jgi:hypothetical protein
MSKKPPKPIEFPCAVQITPRLIAAVESAIGRKMPPGARVMITAPPVQESPVFQIERKPAP